MSNIYPKAQMGMVIDPVSGYNPAGDQMYLKLMQDAKQRADQAQQATLLAESEIATMDTYDPTGKQERMSQFRESIDKIKEDYNYDLALAAPALSKAVVNERKQDWYNFNRRQIEAVKPWLTQRAKLGSNFYSVGDPRNATLDDPTELDARVFDLNQALDLPSETLAKEIATEHRYGHLAPVKTLPTGEPNPAYLKFIQGQGYSSVEDARNYFLNTTEGQAAITNILQSQGLDANDPRLRQRAERVMESNLVGARQERLVQNPLFGVESSPEQIPEDTITTRPGRPVERNLDELEEDANYYDDKGNLIKPTAEKVSGIFGDVVGNIGFLENIVSNKVDSNFSERNSIIKKMRSRFPQQTANLTDKQVQDLYNTSQEARESIIPMEYNLSEDANAVVNADAFLEVTESSEGKKTYGLAPVLTSNKGDLYINGIKQELSSTWFKKGKWDNVKLPDNTEFNIVYDTPNDLPMLRTRDKDDNLIEIMPNLEFAEALYPAYQANQMYMEVGATDYNIARTHNPNSQVPTDILAIKTPGQEPSLIKIHSGALDRLLKSVRLTSEQGVEPKVVGNPKLRGLPQATYLSIDNSQSKAFYAALANLLNTSNQPDQKTLATPITIKQLTREGLNTPKGRSLITGKDEKAKR